MTIKEGLIFEKFRKVYGHKIPAFNTVFAPSRKHVTKEWLKNHRDKWIEISKEEFCKIISNKLKEESNSFLNKEE